MVAVSKDAEDIKNQDVSISKEFNYKHRQNVEGVTFYVFVDIVCWGNVCCVL